MVYRIFSIGWLCIASTACILAQSGWTKVTDTTASLNQLIKIKSPGKYKGASWVDVNNDGLPDLFANPNKLFINKGNLIFEEKVTAINPSPRQLAGGNSWADVDNDGDLDVVIAQNPSGLYLNDGKGNFLNGSSRLENIFDYAAWGATMADINNDGRLDIVFAHAVGFHGTARRYPARLYIQGVDSTFKMKTGFFFTDSLRPYTVPYFHDYDMDGDMDLFIASGPGGSPGFDFHYNNKINGKIPSLDSLIQMKDEIWAREKQDGQCYNFIDYDNDGDLDLCISNYGGAGQAPTRFYENNGNGTYSSKTFGFTTALPRLSNGWGDYDNDGDLDVITTSDFGATRYYQNNGDKTFTAITTGVTAPAGASGMSAGDIDNDGDLDVYLYGDTTSISLFLNTSLAVNNHFASFTLKGMISNKSAIGATVRLKATINSIPTWLIRQVTSQNTFQGQHDLRVHFGLKEATKIDSLIILWPSGIKEYYTNLPADRVGVSLIEGMGTLVTSNKSLPVPALHFNIHPNPTRGSIFISGAQISNMKLSIFNSAGTLVLKEEITSDRHSIDTSMLQSGTYLLFLNGKNKIGIEKLVKH